LIDRARERLQTYAPRPRHAPTAKPAAVLLLLYHDQGTERVLLTRRTEEVGVHPDDVEILGRLDDMVTISDYLVAPYVGVLRRTPYEFIPQDSEVAQIIEPPVAHLMDDANRVSEARASDAGTVYAPAYIWEGHRIWGATARMLCEFLELLRGDAERLESARVRKVP